MNTPAHAIVNLFILKGRLGSRWAFPVVIVGGIAIECDDERAALRLAKAAASQQPVSPNRGPGRPPKNGRPGRETKAESRRARALAFLKALEEFGPLVSPTVVRVLELKAPRGIGGAMVTVRRVLKEHGFDDKEVFRMVGERGHRRWKPGTQIGEATAALNGSREGGS